MSTVLENPVEHSQSSARRLRVMMAASRVKLHWLGTQKSLTPEQKHEAAHTFGAQETYLSAGKKLLDTRHPAYKAVTSVKSRILSYWKGVTLPYPDPGVRLLKQDQVSGFDQQMQDFQSDLEETVTALNEHYEELKSNAQSRLGRLFNAGDYPDSLDGLFKVEWDFPSVEPPDYLRQLSPEVYHAEQSRVSARFEEAVQMAEEAFVSELAKLVSHLSERLSGEADGKPKVFRDSAIENLTEFFQRFRDLNVGSNPELDELVTQAQQVVRGVAPQELRENLNLREHVADELQQVQTVLDDLLVDRPRRNIIRKPK